MLSFDMSLHLLVTEKHKKNTMLLCCLTLRMYVCKEDFKFGLKALVRFSKFRYYEGCFSNISVTIVPFQS